MKTNIDYMPEPGSMQQDQSLAHLGLNGAFRGRELAPYSQAMRLLWLHYVIRDDPPALWSTILLWVLAEYAECVKEAMTEGKDEDAVHYLASRLFLHRWKDRDDVRAKVFSDLRKWSAADIDAAIKTAAEILDRETASRPKTAGVGEGTGEAENAAGEAPASAVEALPGK